MDPLCNDPFFKPKKETPVYPKVARRFIGALDLGQMQDYSAFVVVEVAETYQSADDKKPHRHYILRYIHRWQLKTDYNTIVDEVVRLYENAKLAGSPLVIDATGVGIAIVNMLSRARPKAIRIPVTITAGFKVDRDEVTRFYLVPKKDLAGVMMVLLNSRRFEIAEHPLRPIMAKEMQMFRVKVSLATGTQSFEAWREKDHDDLVLATALACWWGEQPKRNFDVYL